MLSMKYKLWIIGLVIAAFGMVAASAPVWAAKPMEFIASGSVAVTSMSSLIPAGQSGRVRIEMETLDSIQPLDSNSPDLAGKVLSASQKSNELFSSADLSEAVAIDGSSVGTGDIIATGRYHLNVSNIPGCQIYNEGNWSSIQDSRLKGRGTTVACLNWDEDVQTFVGVSTFAGTLN